MSTQRPVNIDLLGFRFPITAITSIIHRITGVVLFLAIPVALCILERSLSSESAFNQLKVDFELPLIKVGLWLIIASLTYHIVAGLRHLLMDIHIGDSLEGGRLGARLVILISLVLVVLEGVWLW